MAAKRIIANSLTVTCIDDALPPQYIYILSDSPATPPSSQDDGFVPPGWSRQPQNVTALHRNQYVSMRTFGNGEWSVWSTPVIFTHYAEDGTSIRINGSAYGVDSYPSSPVNGDIVLLQDSNDDMDVYEMSDWEQMVGSWEGYGATVGDGYIIDGHLWKYTGVTGKKWVDVGQIQGTPGTPGGNTATVYLYKRSATKITAHGITVSLVYDFAAKAIQGTPPNGWSKTLPSGTDEIYVIAATAYSTLSTDSINSSEWSAPVPLATNGLNSAPVFIYKRAVGKPTDKPADGAVYTFSSGGLSGTLNGWSTEIPSAESDSNPCWVRHATAANTGSSDTIDASEWSEASKLMENGKNAVRIDLDNQADIVACDADGRVRFPRTVSVHARIYDGAQPVPSGVTAGVTDAELAINGVTPAVSMANGILTVTWSFGTQHVLSAAAYQKSIVLNYGNNPYNAVFALTTTNATVIYQLKPDKTEVAFAVNSANQYTPDSVVLNCGYTRDSGSGPVAHECPENGQIDTAHYIIHRLLDASGTPVASFGGQQPAGWNYCSENGITVRSSDSYSGVEFALSQKMPQQTADSDIIDRETVPVVRSGTHGISYEYSVDGCFTVDQDGNITNDLVTISLQKAQNGVATDVGCAGVTRDEDIAEYDLYGRVILKDNTADAVVVDIYTTKTVGRRPATDTYIKTITLPVIRQGQRGVQGKMARNPYYGGLFDVSDNTRAFTVSDYETPYFEYGENKYVWTGENGTFTMNEMGAPYTVTGGAQVQNPNFELMVTDFKYLASQIIFGEGGQLGSWRFSGDWMFSDKGIDGNGNSVVYGQNNKFFYGIGDNRNGYTPSVSLDALNGRASFGADRVRFEPDGSVYIGGVGTQNAKFSFTPQDGLRLTGDITATGGRITGEMIVSGQLSVLGAIVIGNEDTNHFVLSPNGSYATIAGYDGNGKEKIELSFTDSAFGEPVLRLGTSILGERQFQFWKTVNGNLSTITGTVSGRANIDMADNGSGIPTHLLLNVQQDRVLLRAYKEGYDGSGWLESYETLDTLSVVPIGGVFVDLAKDLHPIYGYQDYRIAPLYVRLG